MSPAASPDGSEARRWKAALAAVLRRSGVLGPDDPDELAIERLGSSTYEGIAVRPLYTPADTADLPDPGPALPRVGAWDVRARHRTVRPGAVLDDLENGVTSLWLALGEGGIPLADLEGALDGVQLDLAPVVLDAGAGTGPAAAAFLELAGRRGVLPAAGSNLGADPIGLQARRGPGADADLRTATGLAVRVCGSLPGVRAVTVDATPYHDAGGSDADELAASLATGLAYLRALTDAGLPPAEAFGQLEFRYAVSADQFLGIAKLRAARRVWDRVAEVCGLVGEAARQRQHAVSSSAMTTRRDPWVNLLRGTLACFAAGVGGADAITVQPFDAALGQPDPLARRIARNTSALLVLESGVARVSDPAGGSWYVERLTEQLAGAAWDRFTTIERAGGMPAALETGLVAGWVEDVWQRRRANLAHRRDPITGVSEFPDVRERPVPREPAPSVAAGHGLPAHRYAEEFEELRDRADVADPRPAVFLATIGPAAGYTTRAVFAANLFGAGGLATLAAPGTDPAALATAFGASGARLACLVSSDPLYARHAAAVATALKAAGARKVWLVGAGGRYAGVDGVLDVGVDALAVLREAHDLSRREPVR